MTIHKLIVRFFVALAGYSIRHPRRVIILAVLFTLGVAPGAWRLKLRTDGHALVSENAPAVAYDRKIRQEFGIEDPVVVFIRARHTNGIFNVATVQLVKELTAEFARIEGINTNNLASLATEHGFRTRPGTLLFMTFLETPRQTPAQLAELRDDLRRIELYTGTILSYDGNSTCILIGTPAGMDRTKLYRRVGDIIAAKGAVQDEISITGAPVAEALLGVHILEDLGVPKALLGASTWRADEKTGWKWPGNFYELRRFIARHVGLVPVAMLVMAIIFQVSFRSVTATMLPMAEVGACLMFVFGLMGWCGVPVYLTIAVMPVLLTAMAVTDEIHVYSRYFSRLHAEPNAPHTALVRATMEEMCLPVANTSLTTAIGFASFAFSPVGPVRAFGIFTAIGIIFCLFWSLTVMPALLTLISPERFRLRAGGKGVSGMLATGTWFTRLAALVVRRRYVVLGVVAVIVALSPFGLRKLVIQDSWVDGFDPDSEFSRATRAVNEQYRGMHLLFVSITAGKTWEGNFPAADASLARFYLPTNAASDPKEWVGGWLNVFAVGTTNTPDITNTSRVEWRALIESATPTPSNIMVRTQVRDLESSFWRDLPKAKEVGFVIISQPQLNPEMVRTIDEFARFIEQRPELKVGGVIGAADYIKTTSFMVRPNDPTARQLPKDVNGVKLMYDYYRIVRGAARLREVVDTNFTSSLTAVFLKEANFRDTAKLMADIRTYEREKLTPQGITLGFAGDVAVSQSLIQSIVTTQMQSLLGSLAGILFLTSVLGRSLRWGIYAVIPSALAVLINFAMMGALNIPLGVATSMFAAMTLGNGVDFSIHVLEGFDSARERGLGVDAALGEAMARTGPAVVVNTAAIALGFGVLVLSQVPANARLGELVILGIVNCLLASLLLLPVLLHWWPLKCAPRAADEEVAQG